MGRPRDHLRRYPKTNTNFFRRYRGPTRRTGKLKALVFGIAFASGLEVAAATQMHNAGVKFEYETLKVPYLVPAQKHIYNPDFILPNGIVIETKGLFDTQARAKMRWVKQQHPDLDVRLVFYNANARIAKQSRTTYAKWADTYGFPWAHRTIPKDWLTEAPNKRSLSVIQSLT